MPCVQDLTFLTALKNCSENSTQFYFILLKFIINFTFEFLCSSFPFDSRRTLCVSFPASLASSVFNLRCTQSPRARACRNANHSLGVRIPGILPGWRQLMPAHSCRYTLSLFTNILKYSFFCIRVPQGTRILEFPLPRSCRDCHVSSHNLLMQFNTLWTCDADLRLCITTVEDV